VPLDAALIVSSPCPQDPWAECTESAAFRRSGAFGGAA
jgi:hypothetical protein